LSKKQKDTSFQDLYDLLKKGGLKPYHFAIPAAITLVASFLDGGGLALLIPLAKGIIESNFDFVRELPVFRPMLDYGSNYFSINNSSIFVTLVVIMFGCVCFKSILNYLAYYYSSKVISKMESNLRVSIFDQYLQFGKRFFDEHNAGKLHTILVSHTQRLFYFVYDFQDIIKALLTVVIYLTIMIFISWELVLFVLIIFPILSISVKYIVKKIQRTSKHHAQAASRMSEKISNALSCIPLVKAYCHEETELNWFKGESHQLASCEFSIRKKQGLIPPLQEIVLTIMMVLLLGFMASLLIRYDTGNVASYFIFIIMLRRIVGNFGVYDQFKALLARTYGALNQIQAIFIKDKNYYVQDGDNEFKGLSKSIEIKNLNFAYTDKRPIMNDLSFTVEKGKTTAIVGASGSGKSTLVNLLMRFYECPENSIFLDGEDIRSFSLKTLRRSMAYVTQESYLFNATLKMNLLYGLENEVDDDTLMKAVSDAKLKEFIEKIPKGLETEVGDRGVQLSGGEKQRVAIARAFLKNPDILILDEATSSLDSETEETIQNAIKGLTKDKTTIVIAHRLSTIRNADKIVVLDQGFIVEQGLFNDLLSRRGAFAKYWKKQAES